MCNGERMARRMEELSAILQYLYIFGMLMFTIWKHDMQSVIDVVLTYYCIFEIFNAIMQRHDDKCKSVCVF